MKKYKAAALIFAAGLFLMGIGGGVAFAEYSSFEYGGKRIVDAGPEQIKRLEVDREAGVPFVIPDHTWTYWETEIIVDDSLPETKLIFEAVFNENQLGPEMNLLEEENEEGERRQIFEVNWIYKGQDSNQMEQFWKLKDDFLNAMKEHKVYDYQSNAVKKLKVYMSQEAKKDLENMIWQ
ncbi:hypothetical protein [Lachnoclostridium edouardi]|uniref:hypothetical protein n=1 Tax=Lachnoclostridium edouardi TaxID=1926283 RepID=UPI000C7AD1F6|nr:hypothetical protein [Lachnoclostridium edouardi]